MNGFTIGDLFSSHYLPIGEMSREGKRHFFRYFSTEHKIVCSQPKLDDFLHVPTRGTKPSTQFKKIPGQASEAIHQLEEDKSAALALLLD